VLKGADAVVFVADSSIGKIEENRESLHNLGENLREQGLALENLPFVLQYNKRDLPHVHSIAELEAALNPWHAPAYEAAAAGGKRVYATLHAVSRLLFQRLVNDLRQQPGRPAGAPAMAGAQPAPRPPAPQVGPMAAPAPVSHAPVPGRAPARAGRPPVP